jgi:NAD+ diphosphatase
MTQFFRFPEPSALTGFAGAPLDRLDAIRDDPDRQAALLRQPSTRLLAFCRDKPILKTGGAQISAAFTLEEAQNLGLQRELVMLGALSGRAYFAAQIDDGAAFMREFSDEGPLGDTRELVMSGRPDLTLGELRSLALDETLTPEEIGLLGCAKSVLYWHARHRFCSACGAPSQQSASGWRRDCPSCKAMHFPRTDPVVIMLAVRGDFCLLGRQPRFTKGMYSALAGFLEPGETIENAVRREIREESGVQLDRIAYFASQPWPFPSSIMIGCVAEAISEDIQIDRTELEDCRWFSRAELKTMFEGKHVENYGVPQKIAIARLLMRAWMDGEAPQF